MARRRNLERDRYWRGVIREQRASGLGISAFCREHEVPLSSFFQWRRKLQERQHQDEPAAGRSEAQEDSVAKFVPVQLHSPPTATRAGCEIVLADGCRVIVPTQCDATWLGQILATLKEGAC
ncbi:MAG: transposase [bacterium]|nr:transposase [bacterium]